MWSYLLFLSAYTTKVVGLRLWRDPDRMKKVMIYLLNEGPADAVAGLRLWRDPKIGPLYPNK